MYDQTKQKSTLYSCSIYTMNNILLYDFWVKLQDSIIFKIVAYMEKIWALLPKWAYFSIIYPAMVKLIEMKTGLKLKVKTSSISRWLDDKSMWGLWLKKISSLYIWFVQDGEFTRWEVDRVAWDAKGAGHNHAWKLWNKSNEGKIVESWGGFVYKCSISTLKYAVKQGLYYDTARTIVPADDFARKVQQTCVSKAKHNGFISFDEFIEIRDNLKN